MIESISLGDSIALLILLNCISLLLVRSQYWCIIFDNPLSIIFGSLCIEIERVSQVQHETRGFFFILFFDTKCIISFINASCSSIFLLKPFMFCRIEAYFLSNCSNVLVMSFCVSFRPSISFWRLAACDFKFSSTFCGLTPERFTVVSDVAWGIGCEAFPEGFL